MTSSKKGANVPKNPYFGQKTAFFALFAKTIVASPACILRPSSHQPAEFEPETVGAPNPPAFVTIAVVYQVFIRIILPAPKFVHNYPRIT